MRPDAARDTRCDCSPGDVGADHPGYPGGWQGRIPWQEFLIPPGGQREGDPRYTSRAPETFAGLLWLGTAAFARHDVVVRFDEDKEGESGQYGRRDSVVGAAVYGA